MQKYTGLTHLIKATGYSMKGLKAAFGETAFRHELLLAMILIPLACWLGSNMLEIALLISAVLLLLVVELLNTAIEAAVDRIGTEHHKLSGKAKDLGSAAVFVITIVCAMLWLGELM